MLKKTSNKLSIIGVQNFIREKSKYIFSPLDLQRYFNVTYETARKFIQRGVNRGIYIKVKRGLYFDKSFPPAELEIANKLYQPSYLSFEYALSYYGLIPETVYSITSATPKTTRKFTVWNNNYVYYRLKKRAFTGYLKKEIDGQMVFIAEPEKAFVDYLYFVDLGKKTVYERIDIKKLNRQKVTKLAGLFQRPSLTQLARKIYDQSRRTKEIIY